MRSLAPPFEVDVPVLDIARLQPLIGEARYGELVAQAARTRVALRGCTVWNVNSTATGGGVAEMLQVLVGYILGVGVAVRWLVIGGEAEFFTVTKRLHNRLHGVPGDDGALDETASSAYDAVEAANAARIVELVGPDDVVLLHDPQTAGLAGPLKDKGSGGPVALPHRHGPHEPVERGGLGVPTTPPRALRRLRLHPPGVRAGVGPG